MILYLLKLKNWKYSQPFRRQRLKSPKMTREWELKLAKKGSCTRHVLTPIGIPELLRSSPDLLTNCQEEAHPWTNQGSLQLVTSVRSRKRLEGFPEEVIDIWVDSNRPRTTAAYQSAWVDWRDWRMGLGKDPICGNLVEVLSYLVALFLKEDLTAQSTYIVQYVGNFRTYR